MENRDGKNTPSLSLSGEGQKIWAMHHEDLHGLMQVWGRGVEGGGRKYFRLPGCSRDGPRGPCRTRCFFSLYGTPTFEMRDTHSVDPCPRPYHPRLVCPGGLRATMVLPIRERCWRLAVHAFWEWERAVRGPLSLIRPFEKDG